MSAQNDLWRLILDGDVIVHEIAGEAISQTALYMNRYQTLPCDYADATLLALCELRRETTVFSLDGHFYAYRLENGSYLEVVPGPAR